MGLRQDFPSLLPTRRRCHVEPSRHNTVLHLCSVSACQLKDYNTDGSFVGLDEALRLPANQEQQVTPTSIPRVPGPSSTM